MKFIFTITTVILFFFNSSIFSQNWSTPIVIGNSNYATSADIAIDSNNLIHVVFEVNEKNDHYPDDIYYTFYNTSQWVPQVNISNTDTTSQFPDIKVDKENLLHVIWGDPKYSQTRDIWHTKKNEETWYQPSSLFHTQNDTFTISKVRYEFDSRNRLHLIWFQVPELKYRYKESDFLSDVKLIKRFAFTQDFKIYNDKIHLTKIQLVSATK